MKDIKKDLQALIKVSILDDLKDIKEELVVNTTKREENDFFIKSVVNLLNEMEYFTDYDEAFSYLMITDPSLDEAFSLVSENDLSYYDIDILTLADLVYRKRIMKEFLDNVLFYQKYTVNLL